MRQRYGSQGVRVLCHRDDDGRVSILFGWLSEEGLQAFLDDPDVREPMRLGGMREPVQLTMLDLVEELPH